MIYAEDTNGFRIGEFVKFGMKMQPFLACGPGNVGIVHNSIIDTTEYTGIKWKVPMYICGNTITFKGLAVTDLGFGFHSTTFVLN